MIDIFKGLIDYYFEHINYLTVTLLMTIESSFIPFPSEVVMPPAAWKAAQGELNFVLVVFCGIIGSIIGALINYYISISLGRTVIYKFAQTKIAKYLLISKKNIEKSEAYFNKFGKSSTLIGRLVPGIRQLISIPAGLAKMKLIDFILFTAIGSAIWNLLLSILGYYAYENKELLDMYYSEIWYGAVAIGILFLIYILFKIYKSKKGTCKV